MLLSCKRVLRLADQIYDVHGGEGAAAAAAAAAAGAGARRAVVTKTCKLQHYNMQGILFLSATYSSGGDGGAAAVSSSITHKGRGTCSSLGHGGPSNHIISGGGHANTRLSDDANHDVDTGYSEQQPFECGRTFCPPEMGEHCPLDRQSLSQPRGDPSLILQHSFNHGPLHRINRSLKCPHAYHALLVDAAGTLIAASQSTQQIYHEIGLKYGIPYSQEEIAAKYKAAYGQPWCRYRMRYEDDGRLFWQCIVQEATGCKDPALLEDLYHYYTTEKAWHIGDPDAEKALKAISAAGIKIAVVSNFDTRLRPLMRVLQCYDWFDTIVVSAEVGVEKPNPEIFWTACQELGVKPDQVLHVGDDKTNDIVGASAAGCDSLLWGVEVASFAEVAQKLGVKV